MLNKIKRGKEYTYDKFEREFEELVSDSSQEELSEIMKTNRHKRERLSKEERKREEEEKKEDRSSKVEEVVTVPISQKLVTFKSEQPEKPEPPTVKLTP